MGAAKACSSPYESARNQRVEENKKRLEELGLTDLSRELTNNASTTRPSPGSNRGRPRAVTKEKVTLQLRRSTRNAGGEQPDYVEVEIDIRRRARFDNTGGSRHYSRLYERKYASDEARTNATEKAEALKKMLPQTHGSFVKPMLQSHVTGGFWLGLPVAFCRDYLPKKDDRIILEDDKNEEWETIYLSNKTGLSGGWRGFSLDHGLVDGDALVFELVEPKRFKVHIIRVYGTNGIEAEHKIDDKEQSSEAVDKVNPNKVRQKLIWVTEPEKDNKPEENRVSDTSTDAKTQIDSSTTEYESATKRKEQLDDNYVGHQPTIKEDMECSGNGNEDSKNVDLHSKPLLDLKDCIPSKRLKGAASHDSSNTAVKKEMEQPGVDGVLVVDANNGSIVIKKERVTGIDGSFQFEDDEKACLFETSGGKQQARDLTSYMRSRKHIDVNVKKEMKSSNKGTLCPCVS